MKIYSSRGYTIYIYDNLPTTINECFTKKNKSIVIALIQSNGTGQYGRKWISDRIGNLALSINEINIPMHTCNKITLAASYKTLSSYITSSDIGFTIKDPNDIYFGSKKICGVISHSRNDCTILSTGINLNYSPIETSISLSDIIHNKVEVLDFFDIWLTNYINSLSK